jgi:hypothetical protein
MKNNMMEEAQYECHFNNTPSSQTFILTLWYPELTIKRFHKTNLLTTFWRSKSSLSHLRRVTSCLNASVCLPPASPFSEQRLHALWGVSALDILSRPVSLSTYTAASRSTLFSDESSLSDSAGLQYIMLVNPLMHKNPEEWHLFMFSSRKRENMQGYFVHHVSAFEVLDGYWPNSVMWGRRD